MTGKSNQRKYKEEELIAFVYSDDAAERSIAAVQSNTPSALLKLAGDDEMLIRFRVANNWSVTAQTLAVLSHDESEMIRERVSYHHKTPREDLMRLAAEDNPTVQMGVARNFACPVDVMHKLAESKNFEVLRTLAKNPLCPLSLLEEIAVDAPSSLLDVCVTRLMKNDPKYAGYPVEWVEAYLSNGAKDLA